MRNNQESSVATRREVIFLLYLTIIKVKVTQIPLPFSQFSDEGLFRGGLVATPLSSNITLFSIITSFGLQLCSRKALRDCLDMDYEFPQVTLRVSSI